MRWMSDASTLDAIDRRILRALQTDGRMTYDLLAAAVNLSPSAVLRRVKRLEDAGVAALTIHCRTAQMGHGAMGA